VTNTPDVRNATLPEEPVICSCANQACEKPLTLEDIYGECRYCEEDGRGRAGFCSRECQEAEYARHGESDRWERGSLAWREESEYAAASREEEVRDAV
jgi:hypothetical protein